MSDVFISHVEEDEQDALQIARGLEQYGYSTWYYERDSIPGPSYLLQTGASIEEAQAVIILISRASLESRQITKEVVRAHEAGKPFIPVLIDVTHAAFQTKQPEWREALGAAASVRIARGEASSVTPRIVSGLRALGVRPGGVRMPSSETAVQQPETADTGAYTVQTRWDVWLRAYRGSRWRWVLPVVAIAFILLLIPRDVAIAPGALPTGTPTTSQEQAIPMASSPPVATPATIVSAPAPMTALLTPTRLPTTMPATSTSVATATSLRTTTQTSTSGPTPVVTRSPVQIFMLPVAGPIDVMFDGSSLKVLYEGQLVTVGIVETEGRFRQVDQQKGFDGAFSVALDTQAKRYWTVRGSYYSVQRGIDLRDMTGAIISRYDMPEAFTGDPRHIAWDGESIWVSAVRGGIYKMKVDSQSQRLLVLDSYAPTVNRMAGVDIDGLTWAGDSMWVASMGMLTKLDRSLRIVCKLDFSVNQDPVSWMRLLGVAWDGTYVWIGSHDANLLFRIDPAACK